MIAYIRCNRQKKNVLTLHADYVRGYVKDDSDNIEIVERWSSNSRIVSSLIFLHQNNLSSYLSISLQWDISIIKLQRFSRDGI